MIVILNIRLDDLDISPDFFEYFQATLRLLYEDPTLMCISAYNDNGKEGLIDMDAPSLLYRTDFFPGLGWMLTKELWDELSVKWPEKYFQKNCYLISNSNYFWLCFKK